MTVSYHYEHACTPLERKAIEWMGLDGVVRLAKDQCYVRPRESPVKLQRPPGVEEVAKINQDHTICFLISKVAMDLYVFPTPPHESITELHAENGMLDLVDLCKAIRESFLNHTVYGEEI